MPEMAVTAIGADRPGIVARVTKVLLDYGGNLEDASAVILGGQFAIVLLVRTPARAAVLEAALAAATADLGLIVAVTEVGPGSAAGSARSAPATHVLSVYGADRPGILHAVAEALADRQVNVTDLATRVLQGERPVYAVMIELSLPPGLSSSELVEALRREPALADIESSLQPLDTGLF